MTILTHYNTELVGVDEQIDQHDLGASTEIALSKGKHRGIIRQVTLISSGGDELANAVDLYVFRDDPSIAATATVLTIAAAGLCLGLIPVATTDWGNSYNTGAAIATVGPNGGNGFIYETNETGSIYIALANKGATAINSAAGDNEKIEVNLLIERVGF